MFLRLLLFLKLKLVYILLFLIFDFLKSIMAKNIIFNTFLIPIELIFVENNFGFQKLMITDTLKYIVSVSYTKKISFILCKN